MTKIWYVLVFPWLVPTSSAQSNLPHHTTTQPMSVGCYPTPPMPSFEEVSTFTMCTIDLLIYVFVKNLVPPVGLYQTMVALEDTFSVWGKTYPQVLPKQSLRFHRQKLDPHEAQHDVSLMPLRPHDGRSQPLTHRGLKLESSASPRRTLDSKALAARSWHSHACPTRVASCEAMHIG